MAVCMVLAINEDYALGNDGDLIYHLSKDLKRFKEITTNPNPSIKNYLVMGKYTYQSLRRELPNRQHVVLTKDPYYRPLSANTIVTDSLEKVINHYKSGSNEKEMYLIGGSRVFDDGIDFCDKVYLTLIKDKGKPADTYFNYPKLIKYFEVVNHETHSEDGLEFAYITYERKKEKDDKDGEN